jgi:hypothetical protein
VTRTGRASLSILLPAMMACGGASSRPPTATGIWTAEFISAAAGSGEQGQQSTLQLSLTQDGNALDGTIATVVRPSGCFPNTSVIGTALIGQVHLPGGEAIGNFAFTIALPAGPGTINTLEMKGSMQSDANSAAGTYTAVPDLVSCPSPAGTFTMTRLRML